MISIARLARALAAGSAILPIFVLGGCALTPIESGSDADDPASPAEDRGVQMAADLASIESRMGSFDQRLQEIQQQLTAIRQNDPGGAPPPPPPIQPPLVETPPPQQQPMNDLVEGKTLVGRTEWLWVQPLLRSLPADMSTQTSLSFIHVSDINQFERDGERWVSCSVNYKSGRDSSSASAQIESRVERISRSRLWIEDDTRGRPVIQLPVRLGDIQQIADFVLSDTPVGEQPVLLGRNFLKDLAIVDVSERYLQPRWQPDAVQNANGTSEKAEK